MKKLNLNLTREQFEKICYEAMLNEELKKIYEMCIQDYSITKMSLELHMSESSIKRRIKRIRQKINELNMN